MLLSACGGSGGDTLGSGGGTGGGGTGGGGGTPPAVTVTLELVSANTGQPTQTITSANPGKVIATVDGITSAVIVTFETDVGEIPVPTAITDGSNQATVDILAGSSLGAGTITASLSTGESGQIVYAVGATNVKMGNGSGASFQEGQAAISAATISAGGTTTITVSIVDDSNNPFTEPVDVNFSSSCSISNPPTATISTPITTVNGVASSTYLAQGCVGDDPINVIANAGGVNLSSSASVNVLPADVNSIEFVSATPQKIVIQGAGGLGGSENATLVFRVKDTNGDPVNGQLVDFSLNTTVGGIALNPSSATTNSQGEVQTVINSGTKSTTVRVTANINGSSPAILTQSSNLVISTGLPDQDSFSLSADKLNPEGWDIDGNTVNVTARLSDAFNNPVPDGTAVSFTTEGGSIQDSCQTVNGSCSVVWTSTEPRPIGQTLSANGAAPEQSNSLGQSYGGRVTILATAIGEESFPDSTSNGRFDASEVPTFLGNNVSGRPFDLDEAFNDYNEDGIFNPSISGGEAGGMLETFTDFNNDGVYNTKDGLYNGALCSIPAHAGCSATQKSTNVRAQLVLVMSGSNPQLVVNKTIDSPTNNDNDTNLVLQGESTGFASVIIADLHNQPMPAGTTVSFTSTVGSLVGTSTFTWPNDNHNGGLVFSVAVKGESTPKTGSLLVDVETPSGLVTSFAPISITIN
ncbi:MAG TPA: hypothetical protein ENJ60_02995 [Aeromonadales bacterium]|nr:hypothetical protein [Aeromonadales bacterium]